jgi:hypothetical protein
LDYVSGYFIGDYVKNIEYLNEESEESGISETIVYTNNFDYFPELQFSIGILYFWIWASTFIFVTIVACYRLGWLTS